jgi:hypothetical protein
MSLEPARRLRRWMLRTGAGIFVLAMANCVPLPLAGSVTMPPIPEGQARVWFYRDADIYVSLQRPFARMNGTVAGISEPGGTFYRDVPPGHYHVSVDSYLPPFGSTRDLDLFPGQQVYFKVLPQADNCDGQGDTGIVANSGCMDYYVWIMPPEVGQAAVARSQFYTGGG